MNYDVIDPVLFPWATKHNMTIHTEYKESEVRIARIYKDIRNYVGISFYSINKFPRITLVMYVESRNKRERMRQLFYTDYDNLENTLEELYKAALVVYDTVLCKGQP